MTPGLEWVVEAGGCDAARLASQSALESLFADMIAALDLHPVSPPVWQKFPGAGGITGMVLLSESHLAVHTYPEHGFLALNLYSCRPRPPWDFPAELARRFGASSVRVRSLERSLP
ncbi:MAG: S-adenosylmethionine decarboxylase [Bryobacteraceae bacterium]|nr:S-adenosylmethionine decarboxylase [Bryobacteraceae bacterium]MCX7604115.1 S-adenosylmethionine decarboxylase [Bryobacteraceae bacterium]